MPNVFGQEAHSVEEIVAAFRLHGATIRDTYRACYRWTQGQNLYSGTTLERPECLRGNPPGVVFPWEQIFVAAATCAGSDYPMIATHLGVPLDAVEFVVSGMFDPRGEFHGLGGFDAPPDSANCFLDLHLQATLTSSARPDVLERIHEHVIDRNMVLGALRGIPRTSELFIIKGERQ